MVSFIGADRVQVSFMPYDLNEWLPEDHLARFVVEIVSKMDLRQVYSSYSGKGSTPYDPKLLLSLIDIPDAIKRRKDRLTKINTAKKVIEQWRKEVYQEAQSEFDKKQEARKNYENQTGKKPRGKAPKEPSTEPKDKDQYNFTDPASWIMKTSKGVDQCYNAQIVVNDDMLIVSNYANAHHNDKQEFLPTIESVPDELISQITFAVADTGYYSQQNIDTCPKNITPILAKSKERHTSYIEQILNPTKDQQKGIYRKRKHTVEPVFGIIKEVLGFRRFSLNKILSQKE